eukprot:scaffold73802_cov19-Prasinocladus_malaysianus.AAC.1
MYRSELEYWRTFTFCTLPEASLVGHQTSLLNIAKKHAGKTRTSFTAIYTLQADATDRQRHFVYKPHMHSASVMTRNGRNTCRPALMSH